MIGKLVAKWAKAHFASLVGAFASGIDWATLCAKAFSWLLQRAMQSGDYAQVRRVAGYVAEQTLAVLDATRDGEVSPEGCARVAALLEAWWRGEGREKTQALQDAVAGDGGADGGKEAGE